MSKVKFDKAGWPVEVPILCANDIHKGSFNGPDDTHCLVGWLQVAFPKKTGEFCNTPYSAAHRELGTVLGCYDIVYENDKVDTKKSVLAKAWNKAMKRLGYTDVFNKK